MPDGKALLVTYNALIPELGEGIPVSNKAGIEGIVNADSGFDRIINVNSINAGGSGSTYALDFEKVDSTNRAKKLPGATFKFYIVLEGDGEDQLKETDKITVGGKEYRCYSDNWTFTTDDNGLYSIPSGWNLAQGNYYILEELEAPEGYETLKEPILFYFGAANEVNTETHPGATTALPGGTLTVGDPPIQALRVVKKGSAGEGPFPLAGAQFELYTAKKDGDAYAVDGAAIHTGTSRDGDGNVVWEDGKTELPLTPKSYYILRETAAPEGYVQVEGDIVLHAAEDGKLTVVGDLPEGVTAQEMPVDGPVLELTVVDPSGYVLPESGGMGTAWLYGLGTALILTAAMALVCDSRRRRTRS